MLDPDFWEVRTNKLIKNNSDFSVFILFKTPVWILIGKYGYPNFLIT